MWSQILEGDSILTLKITFSRVMRVSTGSDVSSAPSIEQSVRFLIVAEIVVVAAILEDEDVDSLEADVDLTEADRVLLRKGPGNIGIVDVAITSPERARRNLDVLSGHNYLIIVLLPVWYTSEFFTCYSWLFHVVLSQEYDRLQQLEFSQNDLSATYASASGMHI